MPLDISALSLEQKNDIIDPPLLRNHDFGEWTKWPANKPVNFPSEYPTNSHWIKGFRHRLDHYRSSHDLPGTADVIVIGSGMTGCSATYHLTQTSPELDIVVLDARGFCSGATGRNGGHCFRPEGWNMRAAVKRQGAEVALATRRNLIKQRDMIQEVIDEHNIREKVDCVFTGGVHIFGSQSERDDHIEDLKLCDQLGFETGSLLLSADEMSQKIECHNEFGGLYAQKSGSFWPRKFCAEIMEIAIKQGKVNLQTNTCATLIEVSDRPDMRWVVKTARGDIHTKTIIYATNAYVGGLLPEIMGTGNEVIPCRDMVIAVRPRPTPDSAGTWGVNVLARDGYHWLVQMPQREYEDQENLVVYGLHGSPQTTDDETLLEDYHSVLNDYRRYLPYQFPKKFSVVDEKGRIPLDSVESAWTGIMGMTRDEGVIIGPVKEKIGQFTAVGYNGGGMTKCWGSGLVVADMVLWEMGKENSKDKGSQSWAPPDWYPSAWIRNRDML